MNSNIIVGIVVAVAFGVLWYTGRLARLTAYVGETSEELKKCAWPTWDELKGSTVVVFICILILGVFTMVVDFIFAALVRNLT
jgi:preprotein translocase subunit SecE